MTNLLPCPFCGQTKALEIITGCELMDGDQEFWEHQEHWAVFCSAKRPGGKGGCGACGGFAPSQDGAIAKWNTRAK